MRDYNLGKRSIVIAGVAILIVVVYILRLFQLQITSDDYKKSADSNAFLKKIEYPARGGIYDRNGKLLVYNQPAYDIMVVMNEAKDHLDYTRRVRPPYGDYQGPQQESRLFTIYAAGVYEPAER